MTFATLLPGKIRNFSTLLLLLLLGGCAGQVNMNDALSASTQLQSNQGIVVARVINASGYPLPFNHLTIAPEGVNQSKTIKYERLVTLDRSDKETTVFASPVNAGNYAMSDIMSFYAHGDYLYTKFVSANTQFGLFKVEPGKVTDLGTLIYYPKPQGDKYVEVMLRTQDALPGEVLKRHFPFFQFNESEVLGWDVDGKDDERMDLLASVAQNPVVFNKRYVANDDSIYLLGPLGVILKRTPDGDYEIDAVDSNLPLNSIVTSSGGDIAVGGKEGTLFLKRAGSEEWQDISLETDMNVLALHLHQEQFLDVVANTTYDLKVLRANITDTNPAFELVNEFSTRKGWKFSDIPKSTDKKAKKQPKARRIIGAELTQQEDGFVLTVQTTAVRAYSPLSNTKDRSFNVNPENWVSVTEPRENDDVVDFKVPAGKVELGIERGSFWSWTGLPSYYRFDSNSASWQEIETRIFRCADKALITEDGCAKSPENKKGSMESFRFTSLPWFKDELTALAIVNFSNVSFWSGERTSETKIIKTVDGGKTWKDTTYSLPKDYCSSVLAEVADTFVVFCAGATSDFYESKDGGASWQHKRQQDNF